MQGDSIDFAITPELRRGLEAVGKDHGASLFMVTHAALTTLLSRLSNSDDITVGTPLAARGDQALDDLVGMFVNTLVLRTHVRPGDSFSGLVDRVREGDLAAFGNSDVPFEKIVEALRIRRSTAYSPLFQVMLSFQNNRMDALELPGLTVRVIEDMAQGAKYDLTLTITEKADESGRPAGLGGAVHVRHRPVRARHRRTYRGTVRRILEAVVTDPGVAVGDIDILTEHERAKLSQARPARTMTVRELPQLLAAAVDVAPDAVAVAHDGMQVTYREFDERLRLMSAPLSERGMGPDAIVSVVLSGLVPTIMMAPPSEDGKDGFGTILDQVIADAHTLVGDIEIVAPAPEIVAAPEAEAAETEGWPLELFVTRWQEWVERDPQALAVVGGRCLDHPRRS